MNLGGSFTLGRVHGIQIRVHWSWLVIGGFLAWSLAGDVFTPANPQWTPAQIWGAATGISFLFFASILIHELAHSFMAQAKGMTVPSITLFVFGGVSGMSEEMRSAGDEFRIAIVGPLTSWALAIAFGVVTYAIRDTGLAAGFSYLAVTNLALGVFNLLPGFPLDGGRVLRAIMWQRSGDLVRATHVAARAGNVIGLCLILLGVVDTFAFGLGAGLWYVLIGIFLNNAASTSLTDIRLERALEGVTVRDAMRQPPMTVSSAMTLQELVDHRVLRTGERAFLVGDGRDEAVLGVVTTTDLARVPRERWIDTSVAAVMTPSARATTVAPGISIVEALQLFITHDVHELPVVEDGRVIGLLTATDVLQQMQLRAQFMAGR